jgi:hypothetical protein
MTRKSAIYNFAARLSAECAAEYDLYLAAHYERAEIATQGRMLTKRAMSLGVKSHDLFAGSGRVLKALAYASEELREFWEHEPLISRQHFESDWLDSQIGQRRPA